MIMRQATKTRQMAKVQSKGCEYKVIAKRRGDEVFFDVYRRCFEPFDGKFHQRIMSTEHRYEDAMYDVFRYVEADMKGRQL